MTLHAYCIVESGTPPPSATGIASAPLRDVAAGRVTVRVSGHDERPAADAEALRAHNAVTVAAMDASLTPVPLRFGQCFEDEAALVREVSARDAHWLELLDRFRGSAEYGVRIVSLPQGPAGAADAADAAGAAGAAAAGDTAREMHPRAEGPGTQFMATLARRHAEEAHRRELAARIEELVRSRAADCVRDSRAEPLSPAHGLVALAHLVAWNDAGRYHAALRAAMEELGGAQFVVTGPWPPYSFVT